MQNMFFCRFAGTKPPAAVALAKVGALVTGIALTAVLASPASAQCLAAGTNQTCTNSGNFTGSPVAISDTGSLTLTNTANGVITGNGLAAIYTNNDANVTNSGSILAGAGAIGISANNNATVTNSGTISGSSFGLSANNDANVTNSGAISGGNYGINADNNASVTNSGSISAGAGGFGITSFNATVTNSGTISGGSFAMFSVNDAAVTNSGSILAVGMNGSGIFANNNATVTNSGTISGDLYAVAAGANATVTNSGSILAGGNGYGIFAANNASVTNSGSISAGLTGIYAGHDAPVTNSGSISATAPSGVGIYGNNNNATVTNSGSIVGGSSGFGIIANNNVTVTNSGFISGGFAGILANYVAVTNSGTISGGGWGIYAFNNGTVTNSGTISGNVGIYADANVTNSGTIIGTGGTALQFTSAADTLSLLPGSTIVGAINLVGGGDTVNFRGGNHNLTFDTLAGATVSGTTPFAVSGNRAAAIDPTPFAAAGALLTDFTRSVSSLVPSFDNQTAATGGTAPRAFAAPDAPSSIVAETFASIPGLSSAYASDRAVYKAPTVVHSDGTAIWARGFGGQRIQQADGVLLRNASTFFGGAMGIDKQVLTDLRIGAFVGAGNTRSTIDLNSGGNDSNLAFAGAHARYTWGASFLNFAVQGGGSRNDTTRTINNNLAPGGLEIAKASYGGWYVSPDLTYGYRVALGDVLGGQHVLTPSVQVRYLYGSYGGHTETGSTANLTVNSQTVQNLEERAELKLTRTTVVNGLATLRMNLTGGVLGVQRAGDNTVDAVLLGQAIPFAAPGKRDVWGGFGGAGLEFRNANVAMFVAGEYLSLSDSSSVASGKAGLRVSF